MNRMSLLTLAALACLAFPAPQPLSAQTGRVLLVTKEGTSADLDYMLNHEVGVMTRMLKEAGYQVVFASPTGTPLVGKETNLTIDMRLAAVDMADFDGIIMPCMAMETEEELPELEALIQRAVATEKPVAAQLGSVQQLARAGVLKGKKFAYVEEWVVTAPELEGHDYGGDGVVEEGDVITSGVCPWAAQAQGMADTTPALTRAFIRMLEGR